MGDTKGRGKLDIKNEYKLPVKVSTFTPFPESFGKNSARLRRKDRKSLDLSPEDLKALLEKIRNKSLEPNDYVIFEALGNTFILLNQSLNDKETTIDCFD